MPKRIVSQLAVIATAALLPAHIALAAENQFTPVHLPDVAGGYASTQVIVKLKAEATQPVAGAIERPGVMREPAGDAPFHAACQQFGVQRMRRCHDRPFSAPEIAARYGLDRTFILEVPAGTDTPAFVEALRAFPEVEHVELDVIGTVAAVPNDPDFDLQYGMHNTGQPINGAAGVVDADIDATEAWDIHTGTPGAVTIAIIDSGVDPHSEYADRMVPGTNTTDSGLTNLTTDDCFASGSVQHGSHVAGIAAASWNNNYGVAGVNGAANIMPVRVTGGATGCTCCGQTSWAAAGLVWAVDNGADIANMSLQYYCTGWPVGCNQSQWPIEQFQMLEDAVNYAHDNGVLVIAANGNGPQAVVAFPAKFENAVAIAGTNKYDGRYILSNTGPETELAAPGDQVFSTGGLHPISGNDVFGYLSGTSMATPHVSGTASLMLSYLPGLPHTAIRNLLIDSVDDLGDPGRDIFYGYGRINAHRALQMVDIYPIASSEPPDGAIDARQPFEIDGTAPAGWDAVDIKLFESNDQVSDEDFQTSTEGGMAPPPAVMSVDPLAEERFVRVTLDTTIEPEAWTTMTHTTKAQDADVRLGYLPGDVNGDAVVGPVDLLALMDSINGVVPLPDYATDIDRNAFVLASDMERLLDLFEGNGAYESYLGAALP